MRFLLDTHLLIWAAVSPDRLPAEAAGIIESPSNDLYFSAASIWEVAIKTGSGALQLDPSVLRRALLDADYHELAITSSHTARVITLENHHKDPFDRILIAQAMEEGMELLTHDSTVARYQGPIRFT
ncbi:type II toxin-antitoxin system VapC family toxin [Halopseudomonas xiamenensis]|uniref:type II toxin-antitoxin system VapC family toxin n=1 Tax=Halopseudomonas xiamenensis TaxID=157792 RepID=UPI0016273BC5|nr:type II toxin-antitoxin system VapC family toxin [Halopseudomonas xiamenensis]